MASNFNTALRRFASIHTRLSILRTHTEPRCLRLSRSYSADADAPSPPILSKLKTDLKTAMRAKDAPRLAVLRTILAATTMASKTPSPKTTDVHMLTLMRKIARENQEALDEAKAANRQDLVDKEDAQIRIINEYIAGLRVKIVDGEELRAIVQEFVQQNKGTKSSITKALMSKDWAAEGKLVDKKVVMQMLNETLDKKQE